MTRATILTMDDDPMVPRAITRDPRARYGSDRFVVTESAVGEGAMAVYPVHRYPATL